MTALRNGVDGTEGQGAAMAGRPTHRHAAAHDRGHDHGHDHGHPHGHPGATAHGHAGAATASVAAPRVRHSMFLASALERLVIAAVLIGLIWAGILWAIA
jgi:ABC-type Zn2+ transport system substrate-binding protein/surface adhesin